MRTTPSSSLSAAREDAFEWSVIYPNGVRVACESEADARAVEALSTGSRAQWRSGWRDIDVFLTERLPATFDDAVRGIEPRGRDRV